MAKKTNYMFRFKKWRIYTALRELRLEVHKELLPMIPIEERYNLVSQIRRQIDSVILNVAEGSYRKTDKDFAHFLNQANASLYEFAATLDLLLDSGYIKKEAHFHFTEKAELLARQISAFAKKLK